MNEKRNAGPDSVQTHLWHSTAAGYPSLLQDFLKITASFIIISLSSSQHHQDYHILSILGRVGQWHRSCNTCNEELSRFRHKGVKSRWETETLTHPLSTTSQTTLKFPSETLRWLGYCGAPTSSTHKPQGNNASLLSVVTSNSCIQRVKIIIKYDILNNGNQETGSAIGNFV